MSAGVLIVGAGECGARAALALREHGYDGAITLIVTRAICHMSGRCWRHRAVAGLTAADLPAVRGSASWALKASDLLSVWLNHM